MPEQDDVAVAFHVLQQGVVTREQLLDALYAVIEDRTTGLPVRALGTILVQKGYLPHARLRQIIAQSAAQSAIPEEATRGDSIKLGQLLAMAGVVTYGQVMEALLQQEAGRGNPDQPRRRLGEYLVSMGYTTPQAIQRALSYQRKVVYKCGKCEARFNIVNAHPERLYQCVRCEGPLAPEPDSVRVEDSAVMEAFETHAAATGPAARPADVSPPLDRIVADRMLARQLRDTARLPQATVEAAQHWQMEIAQFGLHAPLRDVLRRMRALAPDVLAKLPAPAAPPTPTLPGCRLNGIVACGSRTALYTAQSDFRPGPIGVKILHPEASDEAAVGRFRHDAALLRRFDHPNLLRAYESGTAPTEQGGPLHYVTVEYVRATTLDHMITVKGRLPPTRAVLVALDIANALRHLEKEGFVHCDLAAEHVLIDERLRAKVADLGMTRPTLGRDASDPQTPEDVLSFGKLFRGLLTGSLADQPGADLGSASVSPAVLGVLRATLHPDSSRRFQRFSDLAAVLQSTTQG